MCETKSKIMHKHVVFVSVESCGISRRGIYRGLWLIINPNYNKK